MTGKDRLRAAMSRMRGGVGAVVLLSAMINVLTLTSSIFLMLVYDRVLPGHSIATLFALLAIVSLAFLFHGAFDVMRSQLLSDLAGSLDGDTIDDVQSLEMRIALEQPEVRGRISPTRDLEQVRSFIASPGTPALIDLPWILFFLLVLGVLHYWLAIVTLAGAIVLAALTWVAERINRARAAAAGEAAQRRREAGELQWRHAEVIAALGMRERMRRRWEAAHSDFLRKQGYLTDTAATLSGISRVFRIFLQALVLTTGALLVIDGKATGGIIFASSILSGRALAPVDQAIAHWRNFVGARQSWKRLSDLLGKAPAEEVRTQLEAPRAALAVERITLVPPGSKRVVVADVQFAARSGEAIGIIGPSASGKSSVVRALVGVWKPMRGSVRLDGAGLGLWDGDALGMHIGYLPQVVELFAGTIAENISRFEPGAPPEEVLSAAKAAGVHEMILQLPDGYDMRLEDDGANLSAGQRQRIALARALYRDPFLLVLDEPNSNLDPDGERALAEAIAGVKARGGIVVMVAHRAGVLELMDLLLVMRAGTAQSFGPREEVLDILRQAGARAPGRGPAPAAS